MVSSLGIVEDDPLIAELVSRTLTALSYRVAYRSINGELGIIASVRSGPDLVLMDIGLGGLIDGIDAADYLYHVFGIPVVFLTSYYDDQVIDRAKLSGPFGYILKPFTGTSLRASIEIALHSTKNPVLSAMREDVNRLLTSGDPIAVTTARGRVLYLNDPFEDLVRMKSEDATMNPFSEVIQLNKDQGDLAFTESFFLSLDDTQTTSCNPVISFSRPFTHRSPGKQRFLVRLYPVWKSGGILAVILRLEKWTERNSNKAFLV